MKKRSENNKRDIWSVPDREPKNYTCTYLAAQVERLDHNSVYRFLKNTKHPLRELFEEAKKEIIFQKMDICYLMIQWRLRNIRQK